MTPILTVSVGATIFTIAAAVIGVLLILDFIHFTVTKRRRRLGWQVRLERRRRWSIYAPAFFAALIAGCGLCVIVAGGVFWLISPILPK